MSQRQVKTSTKWSEYHYIIYIREEIQDNNNIHQVTHLQKVSNMDAATMTLSNGFQIQIFNPWC